MRTPLALNGTPALSSNWFPFIKESKESTDFHRIARILVSGILHFVDRYSGVLGGLVWTWYIEQRERGGKGDLLITMSGNRHDGTKETWVGKVTEFRGDGNFSLNQRLGILRPRAVHK